MASKWLFIINSFTHHFTGCPKLHPGVLMKYSSKVDVIIVLRTSGNNVHRFVVHVY